MCFTNDSTQTKAELIWNWLNGHNNSNFPPVSPECGGFMMPITFGGTRIGFIMSPIHWYSVSLVGEECIGLDIDHFKRIIFFLGGINSEIRFDFKRPLNLFALELLSFYAHNSCVPIVRDLFCCLQTKHYTPLCIYLMCGFCCPGRGTVKKRRDKWDKNCQTRPICEKQEFRRSCCFWNKSVLGVVWFIWWLGQCDD